jgi:C-terminal processing protease CtpA/Prc
LIQPDNFVKKSEPQNLPANQESSPISVKEILSIMGINVELENGKWKVRSVTANGVGESSGVRADDIVEAIDEQPLSSETVFNKIVKGKKMTVTRKGEKSQLELRNKQ